MRAISIAIVWSLGIVPILSAEMPELMPIDEIRTGMKGIGKTVFSGTTIEEFDVEIVGVLKNQTPHGDTIMAKISGGPLPIEKSGVIAGMSGSPIYIEGKLIGALAFASIFAKEPMIAGITPIHEMLVNAARPAPQTPLAFSMNALSPETSGGSPQLFNLVPIKTPLVISGADQRLFPVLQEQLASFNLLPVPVGNVSQAAAQEADTELHPGSAVGVQFVRGDMDISGVGTVTYRENDAIIAFGHPMFLAGNVNFPMASAYVHLIMQNQILPYKVASPLQTVGAITQDRSTGISGVIGMMPRMIPLNVAVKYGNEQTPAKHYAFEVIDHPLFAPIFLSIAGIEALLATEHIFGDTTIRTRTTITLKDHPPLILDDMFTGNANIPGAILKAFAPLGVLMHNTFEPVTLDQVSLEMTVTNAIQFAEIVGMRVPDHIVRPGEVVKATISLRPYGGALMTVAESISIPEDLQQERILLLASDVNVMNMFEAARATAKFQPQNLEQLMTLFREQISQNHLVMSVFQMKPGAVVQGQEFPAPPVSMMSLIESTKRSAGRNTLTRGRILNRKDVPTDYFVSGYVALELIVNHSDQGREEPPEEIAQPIPEEGEIPQ